MANDVDVDVGVGVDDDVDGGFEMKSAHSLVGSIKLPSPHWDM